MDINWEKVREINKILDSNVGNRIVTVYFVKKDGTERKMQIMRSRALENSVRGTHAEATAARKWTLTLNGMKTVEELTPNKSFQWRTVNLNTIKRIAVGGIEYHFS